MVAWDQVTRDDVLRAMQEAKHAVIEATMADVRALGDAVLACFFAEAKPRARQAALHALQDLGAHNNEAMWAKVREHAVMLKHDEHLIRPFHWEVEFPEAFSTELRGFDAIVGNPPFLGGKRISTQYGENYSQWLQTLHADAGGSADLVAHFFRRAFYLLKHGGCFGLIATNTIGQGDTRESGLCPILKSGGSIRRAIRRLPWPGEAAVIVSVVHVSKQQVLSPVLDGQPVPRISAYLISGDLDDTPTPLAENSDKAFIGNYVFGLGFTFDDDAAGKGKPASTIAEMRRLIATDSRNQERIFPYLGGEEINSDPRHAYHRWVIDFNDFPLRRELMKKSWAAMNAHERATCRTRGVVPSDYADPVAADWEDLLAIVEHKVKPERDNQKREALRERWWQYADKRPSLRRAILSLVY